MDSVEIAKQYEQAPDAAWYEHMSVSLVDAILLVLGIEPQTISDTVETLPDSQKPAGYNAVRRILVEAIIQDRIAGELITNETNSISAHVSGLTFDQTIRPSPNRILATESQIWLPGVANHGPIRRGWPEFTNRFRTFGNYQYEPLPKKPYFAEDLHLANEIWRNLANDPDKHDTDGSSKARIKVELDRLNSERGLKLSQNRENNIIAVVNWDNTPGPKSKNGKNG